MGIFGSPCRELAGDFIAIINIHAGVNAMKTLRSSETSG
jgi:hypothetical protein